MNRVFYLIFSFLLVSFSCKSDKEASIVSKYDKVPKQVIDPYINAKEKAIKWMDNLNFDLDYIQKKKLGDKKFLAEYLGFYWKLYKNTDNVGVKKSIKKKLQSYYEYTKQRKYHNMQMVDAKLFKKNSMSYLRVMWLLKELGFDITNYQKEVKKVKGRMDSHLQQRGNWQREVFKYYYEYFNMKMPKILLATKTNNGIIDSKLTFEKYTKNKAYNFTHFIFAGFEYGKSTTQNRFDAEDKAYIKDILPKFTHYYREIKPNEDLLGEFVTCMVYMGYTKNEEFEKSHNYLLQHQNKNGSWGKYESIRKKIGNDIDFRAYLHTTLVVTEALLEYNEGDFVGSRK